MNGLTDRPDYVPAWWLGSPRSRLWRDPAALARRLILVPVIAIAAAALVLAVGASTEGILLVVWALVETATAVVYAPRALRAARSRRPQ